jgi:chemotaxis protein methyltransferase CheR
VLTPSAAFERLRVIARESTGIEIDADKSYLVETRLESVLRTHRLNTLAELVSLLDHASNLRAAALEAIANGETFFFRDATTFRMISRFIQRLVVARSRERRLRIWCAACSTGQEPYSLAMLLADEFPELDGWDIEILATDFSDAALERARAGRYTQFEVNRGLPARSLVRHFTSDGVVWQISDSAKRRVRFERYNLLDGCPPVTRPDLVLLRNVMLYFSLETRQRVLADVRRVLAPDGALILGAAETTYGVDDEYVIEQETGASLFRPFSRAAATSVGVR